jgi:hypothetical protein
MSRLRVNSLTNKTNDGAPEFTHGASVVGVVTATSFSGDGSGLTNITGATQIINSGVPYGTATGINFGDNFAVESIDAQGNATLSIDLSAIDFSDAAGPAVDAALADLIGAAPATLDTIQELAAALGDDPNFSVTLATSLGEKANLAGGADFTGDVTVSGALTAGSISFANLTEL